MKIAVCGDIHISKTSSIIKSRGEKYSTRLENCIKSLNWFEEVAKENNCDIEVFLGDTFDKPVLDDEIITAMKDINWNNLSKYFLVGNHESSVNNLTYNSTMLLSDKNMHVIKEATNMLIDSNTQLHFIPYIIETDREPLINYLNNDNTRPYHIIFSHNDIKGINFGNFISKDGFEIDEIQNNCNLYINGHLHNGGMVTDKIINLGILTGQNFNEDAFKYKHHIMILDTNNFTITYIENPYAFNFYKIEINNEFDLDKLYNIGNNAILSIKCNDEYLTACKGILSDLLKNKIVESKLVVNHTVTHQNDVSVEDLHVDHIQKFIEFIKQKIDNTTILEQELNEICK